MRSDQTFMISVSGVSMRLDSNRSVAAVRCEAAPVRATCSRVYCTLLVRFPEPAADPASPLTQRRRTTCGTTHVEV